MRFLGQGVAIPRIVPQNLSWPAQYCCFLGTAGWDPQLRGCHGRAGELKSLPRLLPRTAAPLLFFVFLVSTHVNLRKGAFSFPEISPFVQLTLWCTGAHLGEDIPRCFTNETSQKDELMTSRSSSHAKSPVGTGYPSESPGYRGFMVLTCHGETVHHEENS